METLQSFVQELIAWCTTAGIRLILCLILLIVGMKLIKWVVRRLRNGRGFSHLEPSLRSFLSSATSIALNVLLILTVAGILGVPMASFVTVLASCGVAIGLAMQGSLSNLAGGVMLLLFHPFRVGDSIETASASGTVRDISVFYTVLITPDNKTVTIPNGSLTNSVITNSSTMNQRRVDLDFTVSADADVKTVTRLLLDTASAHPKALKNPEPFARLIKSADGASTFSLRVWSSSEDFGAVQLDLLEQVKQRLDQAGISAPRQKLEIYSAEKKKED